MEKQNWSGIDVGPIISFFENLSTINASASNIATGILKFE
jgi:hypothetical protein